MEDLVALADAKAPVEHHVGADPRPLAHVGLRAYDGIGAHFHARREPRARMDDRRRMRRHRYAPSFGLMAQRMFASATVAPSTRATQVNLPMPRMKRSIDTSSSRTSPGTTGFLKRALSMPT
jgi:hypothetical protein